MKIIVLGLLTSWVLMMPDARGTFGSAAFCEAAIVGFQTQVRDGARWINEQYRAAPTGFWLEAVHRAAGQLSQARAARCVEVRPS